MVDVRSLTASFNRGDTPSKHKQDNATKKSKRGGRRVNRNESFEDLFSGNAFEDDKVKRPPDDEVSLNSSQISFQAPFSSSTSNLEEKSRSHFCGESDEEMSGDEDPFANAPKRRGARKGHHNDIEYDAGSVDFNDGDFDFTNDTIDEQALEAQDSEASFSWSKPEGEARQHERANEFNSTIGKSSLRKEKKRIPLSTVITATRGAGSPVSSIASSSIVSRQKNTEDKLYKGSSTTSPTSALDIDAFEGEHRSPPPLIDTNTPEGVAGNYVMGPGRSRAQSRSRATSRGRNPRGASRSRSRVGGGELRSSLTKKEEDFQPVFPDSVDPEIEEDLFAGKEAAERSARSKTRDPGSSSRSHSKDPSVDRSSSTRSRSKSRSRDSELEPSSSSRSHSKSRARDSEPESSSSRAPSKSRARDSERESSSSRTRSKSRARESKPESSSSPRSKSRSRKSTTTDDDSATETSPKKVTRIKIKAKGGGKLDPATAKRLIAEKMKQLKDSGDTSESASALEAMKDLFIVETKNGESANFNQSIRLDESSNNIDLGLDEIVEENTKEKKHKKKSKELGDKTKSRKHRSKESSENHDSFTDSVLSKSNSSLNASSRFEESFQVSADLTSAFNASMKLTTHQEEETGEKKERKSRSRSQSPEKKHRPRGRSESPVKKSKEHNSESKDKERLGRSRSPTKKHRERSESPHKRSKEGRTRCKSPSKRSKEESARSKSRARTPKE
eukprot:scaffold8374_cov175-Amphora_coffeaeformis.AAC.22